MISFQCDNSDIEHSLKKLVRQVIEAGGWLNENIIISCNEGSLSLHTHLRPELRDVLISLPEESLLPLEKVVLGLAGDDLYIVSNNPELSIEQLNIFETLLEIYNLTNKISMHCQSSPWVALLSDTEFLKLIAKGRSQDFSVYIDDAVSGNHKRLKIKSFTKTRSLNFGGNLRVLMPIIDFVNNHPHAEPYLNKSDKHDCPIIGLLNSHPVAHSMECYVRYGILDAYDIYLIYNYVERASFFIRSIPLKIELEDIGVIYVNSLVGFYYDKQLPLNMSDLRFYMPVVLMRKDNALSLSHLIIPDFRVSPLVLRRVLEAHIILLKPDISQSVLKISAALAESYVLSENTKYYQDLRDYIHDYAQGKAKNEALEMISNVINIQLLKLHDYL